MQKTMNSIQISDILSNNRITHGKFMGVFAADTLKTFQITHIVWLLIQINSLREGHIGWQYMSLNQIMSSTLIH